MILINYEHSLIPVPRWDISAEIEELRSDKYIPREVKRKRR